MSVFAYVIVGILGLLKKKSKFVTAIIAIIMILMFAGARNIADTQVYLNRYNYVNLYSSFTEWLYTIVSLLFSNRGIDFYTFWGIVAVFCVCTRIHIIKKLTPNVNFVLVMYCLFPFYLDVCWMRMTFGMSFIYIAFYLWLMNKSRNKIKALLQFSIMVIIASGFHAGLLVYFILLIPEYVSLKRISIVTAIISLLGLLLTRNNRLYNMISRVVSEEKANIILSTSSYGTVNTWLLYTITSVILLSIIIGIMLYIAKKHFNKRGLKLTLGNTELEVSDFFSYLVKLNILLLVVISVIPFSGSFHRIQLYMIPIFLIGISYCFNDNDRGFVIGLDGINILVTMLIGIAIIFYIFIYHTSIFNSVFIPFFKDNVWL